MDDLFSYARRKQSERNNAEVEAKPRSEEPLTVSQLNAKARAMLENDLGRVSVVGELSGCKNNSGHRYFSLKDGASQVNAVLFRREARGLSFDMRDGVEVLARGKLSIYSPYGRYQFIVDELQPLGAGALQAAFEKLKRELAEEGLFSAERKRPLPTLPGRVAVVSSERGAVIRDIIHVACRRFPGAHIVLIPCAVQGAESAPSIASAIRRAGGERQGFDVVIVARGGGSLEDLWGFNDERVARAIAECPVPVLSSVGHETDFTIADFVADVRAPTPSAAAELVWPVASELRARLRGELQRGAKSLTHRIERLRHRLDASHQRLSDPERTIRDYFQRLVYAQERSKRILDDRLGRQRARLAAAERRLVENHPKVALKAARASFAGLERRIGRAQKELLERHRERLVASGRRLHALSPLAVLDRGYAITLKADTVVRDASAVNPGDAIEVRVRGGRIAAMVREVTRERNND